MTQRSRDTIVVPEIDDGISNRERLIAPPDAWWLPLCGTAGRSGRP